MSRQDDSLREELPGLLQDVDAEGLKLGWEAFGNAPEAVNLWIGDSRAVSAAHKDHYENLYAVVRGEKVFTLMPPCDAPFLCEHFYPSAQYVRRAEDGTLQVEREGRAAAKSPAGHQEGVNETSAALARQAVRVPWIPVDIADPDAAEKWPVFGEAAGPLQVRVKAGEVLYLPALWVHQVAQEGLTVAVNYGHEMRVDGPGYVYHQFLRKLVGLVEEEETAQTAQAALGSAPGSGFLPPRRE